MKPRHQTFDHRGYMRNDGDVGVFVCGFPSSGNRVIGSVFGAHGVNFYIFHWVKDRQADDVIKRWGDIPLYCVMPIRDSVPRKASLDRRNYNWIEGLEDRLITHYENTLRLTADRGIPVMPIRYEAFVKDPEGVSRKMLEWVGVEYKGLPFEVIDGNEKWLSPSQS
jgi:hypothetical protein